MADAEAFLRDLMVKIAQEQDFGNHELEVKAINSGGANYTSVLFLVTVKCSGKKDVELFAKVACVGDQMREMLDAKKMYDNEVMFYTKLSKIYEAMELKHNVADEDRFVVSKFYGCNTDLYKETVVLQNLVADGYASYDRFSSLDWEHAASSIENLAKLHALSFAYQKKNPEEFEELSKDLGVVEFKQDESMKEYATQLVERALGVVKEEYRPRILKLLEELGEDPWTYNRFMGTTAICHGDFRASNMLYKKQDDKVQAIVVDYQLIHIGCPAYDFMYFLLCGTDSKFRAEHHDRLVDHYHTELSAALQRLDMDVTEVYPREVFDSELRKVLPWMVSLGMLLLPVVLVEAEQAPSLEKDASMESFAFPTNDLYAERFTGIVEDCIKWGVL